MISEFYTYSPHDNHKNYFLFQILTKIRRFILCNPSNSSNVYHESKVIQSVHIISYHNIVSASALGYIKHMNYLWLLKGQHMLSYQFTTNHLTLLTSAVHKTQQYDEEEMIILK